MFMWLIKSMYILVKKFLNYNQMIYPVKGKKRKILCSHGLDHMLRSGNGPLSESLIEQIISLQSDKMFLLLQPEKGIVWKPM